MSFLGQLFQSNTDNEDANEKINPTTNIQWIAAGGEAHALITDIKKVGNLKIVIDTSETIEDLKAHLTEVGTLLICPHDLSELTSTLDALKDFFPEHPNILCRVVTKDPVIINAIVNKSCLLYPPTTETLKTFYQKLHELKQAQRWNESSEKKNLEYAMLSPLPSSFFSALKQPTEINYPVLQNTNISTPTTP